MENFDIILTIKEVNPDGFVGFVVDLIGSAISVSLERIFSTCGRIWSKLGNGLRTEKALNFVKIFTGYTILREVREYQRNKNWLGKTRESHRI